MSLCTDRLDPLIDPFGCIIGNSHVRPLLGTLSDLFRMLSPSSVKQIPVRSSLQLQLLSRISQIWLPVDSKSTDPRIEVQRRVPEFTVVQLMLLSHFTLPHGSHRHRCACGQMFGMIRKTK